MENLGHHKEASSILERDDRFFHKVLSRDPSMKCSSQILYYRCPGGVPFKWEMQPGIPKDPPKEVILPPLSPPPTVLSLGCPKPCINANEPPRVSLRSRLMFWKRGKQNQTFKNNSNNKKAEAANNGICLDNLFASDQFYNSDGDEDFMASSSSSSESLSFSNVLSSHSSRLQSPARESIDHHHHHQHHLSGCSPLNLSSVVARVTKR